MVEDFLELYYEGIQSNLSDSYKIGWQEQIDFTSQRDDLDAAAMYCMMSV